MKEVAKFEKVSEINFINAFKKLGCSEELAMNYFLHLKLPSRATKGSAGYDFFAPLDITLAPNQSITVPTGIRVNIIEGWVLQIFPKSGLGFKFRLQLDNTVGIIDSDYYYSDNEGHIFCKITNCSLEGKTINITKGNGFCQGIFLQYGITTDDCVLTERNGGFGSTNN